ncbi:MAG: carboxypeptidase regulatory-like domain-containing protein, partial [Bacilli bacterium]|nr:carboxypeptidase regulatory-like domain-containing protein [Bacilli bacterium]
MKNKKKGRIIAISLIAILVVAIAGILKISSVDKFKGLVKVNKASLTSISTKLSANISDLSADNNIEVKGYDEVDYNISYTLSDYSGERDVIINAKIDENDPYASFKEVTGTDITSVLSSNRKEITITISNLPSNQPINSKVTMLIVNAPKGYTVRPTIRIKESTASDYTNITVRDVTVNTSSVQGRVIDEEGNIVPNILISLKKNTEVIKETYTNSEGIYTLSDITPDTYSVVVNEENYEDLELNNLYIQDGNMLNLIVRRVYPYKIETNKYITKVELNNLGSSKDYLYNDVTLANIPVRKVNNLHGKIYYKITVQNTGEKAGIISSVKDELPEGLSFDESLNSGYELKNGIIYNRNLEGVELSAGEQISDTLVLTIENTDIARTYINKVNARGELYEHVVYLLNGQTYKT